MNMIMLGHLGKTERVIDFETPIGGDIFYALDLSDFGPLIHFNQGQISHLHGHKE